MLSVPNTCPHHASCCSPQPLLLSSSRTDAKLWRGDAMNQGPKATWDGVTRARFNPAGTQVRCGVHVGVQDGRCGLEGQMTCVHGWMR